MGIASKVVYTIVYILVFMICCLVYGFTVLTWELTNGGQKIPWRKLHFIQMVEVIMRGLFHIVNHFVAYLIALVLILYGIRLILLQIFIIGPIILKIPPFPDFEDSGLFGLIDRILGTFGKYKEKIWMSLGISTQLILLYARDTIKAILKELFPDMKFDDSYLENMLSGKIGDGPGDPVINYDDQQAMKNEKKKTIEDEYYGKTMQLITIETNNCINKKIIPITPNFSVIDRVSAVFKNESSKITCQAESVDSYIKANLQYLMI